MIKKRRQESGRYFWASGSSLTIPMHVQLVCLGRADHRRRAIIKLSHDLEGAARQARKRRCTRVYQGAGTRIERYGWAAVDIAHSKR